MKKDITNELLKVAELYYREGYSQKEIAKKLYYSTSKVSRLLNMCIDKKIVSITINYPAIRCNDLENRIKDYYKLNDVVIFKDYQEENNINFDFFTKISADYIKKYFKDFISVGISSGETIAKIIDNLDTKQIYKNIDIYQVKGMASDEYDYIYDNNILVKKLSDKLNAKAHLIYSPLYVRNDIVYDYLVNEINIKKVLFNLKRLDILITTISGIDFENSKSAMIDYLKKEIKYNINRIKKASGVMMGHFLTLDGKLLDEELDKYVVGMSLKDISNCKNTILVAYGLSKSEAVYSALNSNTINTLVVNENIGNYIVKRLK